MVFDPTYPEIDMGVFKICDWREFYGNITEIVPGDAPKALGKMVDIRMFVDSDHAGDKLARRSRTGFFSFINGAPVMWLSKKQTTVETSVFGAEFVAMKQGAWITVQVTNVGSSNQWSILHLWRQHVRYSQHATSRIDVKEEVE